MKQSSSYSWTDYGDDLVKAVMPWIVFAALALIVFILAIVIRFLKAICCKSAVKVRGERTLNTCVGISVIITFLSMGCCGYIIHYSDGFYQSYMQLQCTAGRIPYALLEGNLDYQWIGLATAKEDLDYIIDVLNEKYDSLTRALWDDTEWLQSDQSDFQSALDLYYSNFSSSKVSSPDPYEQDDVRLDYIEDLGDQYTQGTWTFKINQEYTSTITPIDTYIYGFKQVDLASIGQIGNVVDEINSADDSIQKFIDGNKEVNDNIKTWIRDNHTTAKQGWRGFTLAFVLIAWFICIGILITVSSKALNKPKLAHGLCCYWMCTGFISVLGFVLSIGFLSIGIVSNDSCGLIDSLLDPSGLKKYDVVVPDYIYDYMNVCLNEGGDLDAFLGLNETFQGYAELIDQEEFIYNDLGISYSLANFQSIKDNSAEINKLKGYKDIVDESDNLTPEFNLAELNKFTDASNQDNYLGNCSELMYDQWVFLVSGCGTKEIISPGNPQNRIGQSSCLVISSWNTGNLNSRYSSFLTCTFSNSLGNYLTNIEAYQQSLKNFQTSVDGLAARLTAGLNEVNDTISQAVNHLVEQRTSIHDYFFNSDQLGQVYVKVFGDEGLLKMLNCKFVRNYMKTLKKSFCDNARESIYQVFIFIFVLSFFLVMLEFVNLYLSRALLKPEERESLT